MTEYEFVKGKKEVRFVPKEKADCIFHAAPISIDNGLWKAIIKQIKKELETKNG